MALHNPLTVIDIGTTKIVCMHVVADDSTAGFAVLGYAFHECAGLSRGAVVDIDETVRVIQTAIRDVESQTSQKIRDVVIGISGHHVNAVNSHGIVGIRNKEVTTADVDRVIEAAKAIAIPDNETVLHTLPQEFIVDNQSGVMKPVGMSGVRLEARVLMLRAASSALQNLTKCVEFCGLRVKQIIAQQLAASRSVLSGDERNLGVCLLDIGGGTTDIVLCKQRSLTYVSSVPIAGGHVTNDIAVALRTPPKSAETTKVAHGRILSRGYEGGKNISVESLSNQSTQKVSVQLLAEVMEARYQEIFSFVKKDLREKGLLGSMPGGIVLTGGGAKVPGLIDFAGRVFNCQVRLAEPKVALKERSLRDARYAAPIGLILQALEERDRLEEGRSGSIGRMWKRFQYWLDYHL